MEFQFKESATVECANSGTFWKSLVLTHPNQFVSDQPMVATILFNRHNLNAFITNSNFDQPTCLVLHSCVHRYSDTWLKFLLFL
jgi:hypothetical protein